MALRLLLLILLLPEDHTTPFSLAVSFPFRLFVPLLGRQAIPSPTLQKSFFFTLPGFSTVKTQLPIPLRVQDLSWIFRSLLKLGFRTTWYPCEIFHLSNAAAARVAHGELAQPSQSRAEAGEHQLRSCQALPTDQSSPGNRFIGLHREGRSGRRSRPLVHRRGAEGGGRRGSGLCGFFCCPRTASFECSNMAGSFPRHYFPEFRFKCRQNVRIYLPLHHNLNIFLRQTSGATKERGKRGFLFICLFCFCRT